MISCIKGKLVAQKLTLSYLMQQITLQRANDQR